MSGYIKNQHVTELFFVVLLAAFSVRLVYADAYVGLGKQFEADTAETGFNYFGSEQVLWDDNLFRLPSTFANFGGATRVGTARSDRILQSTFGINEQWVGARQIVAFDLLVSHNSFQNNTFLDNNSGAAHLLWDWSLGTHLSGQIGADHERGLASFASTRIFQKDLLDTDGYFTSSKFQMGPRWALLGEARKSDTRHGLQAEKFDAINIVAGSGGIQYATSTENTIELQYKFQKADYPYQTQTATRILGNFKESSTRFLVHYEPSDRTLVTANAGYIERKFDDYRLSSYSGNVWSGSVQWQASGNTLLGANVHRDLQAAIEAQTEYFITTTRSLNVTWTPRDTIVIAAVSSWQNLNLLTGSGFSQAFLQRMDNQRSQSVSAAYSPRSWLIMDLSLTFQQRSSNYAVYSYNDRIAKMSIKITL